MRLFFFREELNIIHNKEVVLAIFILKTIRSSRLHRIGIINREFFRGEIKNFLALILFFKLIADGLDEMRFSAAGVAVNEERIIGDAGTASMPPAPRCRQAC